MALRRNVFTSIALLPSTVAQMALKAADTQDHAENPTGGVVLHPVPLEQTTVNATRVLCINLADTQDVFHMNRSNNDVLAVRRGQTIQLVSTVTGVPTIHSGFPKTRPTYPFSSISSTLQATVEHDVTPGCVHIIAFKWPGSATQYVHVQILN